MLLPDTHPERIPAVVMRASHVLPSFRHVVDATEERLDLESTWDHSSNSKRMASSNRNADRREEILALVRRSLAERPGIGTTELKKRATRVDRGIGRLDTRVFHGRYVLAVLRSVKAERKHAMRSPAKGRRSPRGHRTATNVSSALQTPAAHVRDILLEFAGELAGADAKETVNVLSKLDQHVHRIMVVKAKTP
jgi:hypothetical protein